jgi:aminobenzoyl-glutamate utilization protein B
MLKDYKECIAEYIDQHKSEYHQLAQEIWGRPELGLEEHFAAQKLTEFLMREKFKVERHVAGLPTAFIATWGDGKPVIGFSAEYDALPGLSQKKGYKKAPVVDGAPGHGCGHNILGVGGIFAAVALREVMEKHALPGSIKVFGTPAEELCIGKPVMGNAGVFEGTDIILECHPLFQNSANYDTCPAYFNVKYHFKGSTAHGNAPWYGRSALDAAILMGHAIEMLREHTEPTSILGNDHTINYTFSDTGPEFPSVVPDRATLWCVGRFSTGEYMKNIMRRVDQCAEGAALATETQVEKEYITASHEMIPNKIVSKALHENLTEIGAVVFTDEERKFVELIQEEEGTVIFYFFNNLQVLAKDFLHYW